MKTTNATVELADNGYIVRYKEPHSVFVYDGLGDKLPDEMLAGMLADLQEFIDNSDSVKFGITIITTTIAE